MDSISHPICFHFYRGICTCSQFFRIRWFVQYVHEETRSQKSFCLPASNFAGKLSQKTWTKKSKKYSLTLLKHYIYMEFATTRKHCLLNKRWHECVTNFKMKWKIQIQWNDLKYQMKLKSQLGEVWHQRLHFVMKWEYNSNSMSKPNFNCESH